MDQISARHFDMTRLYWGHNWDVKQASDGLLRGFCWLTPAPRVGDSVRWRTSYGEASGEVVEAIWTTNVDDMYRIAVRVTARHVPRNSLSERTT
jgi:hypothetical protein